MAPLGTGYTAGYTAGTSVAMGAILSRKVRKDTQIKSLAEQKLEHLSIFAQSLPYHVTSK